MVVYGLKNKSLFLLSSQELASGKHYSTKLFLLSSSFISFSLSVSLYLLLYISHHLPLSLYLFSLPFYYSSHLSIYLYILFFSLTIPFYLLFKLSSPYSLFSFPDSYELPFPRSPNFLVSASPTTQHLYYAETSSAVFAFNTIPWVRSFMFTSPSVSIKEKAILPVSLCSRYDR